MCVCHSCHTLQLHPTQLLFCTLLCWITVTARKDNQTKQRRLVLLLSDHFIVFCGERKKECYWILRAVSFILFFYCWKILQYYLASCCASFFLRLLYPSRFILSLCRMLQYMIPRPCPEIALTIKQTKPMKSPCHGTWKTNKWKQRHSCCQCPFFFKVYLQQNCHFTLCQPF